VFVQKHEKLKWLMLDLKFHFFAGIIL